MKLHITILFFFFGCLFVFAQYSISGKITNENNETIPFANVILHQKGSKKTPKGVVSDDSGLFLFENIAEGNYQLEISVLGFQIKKSEEFMLSANKKIDFILKEESQKLDEVVVKSKRPVIKQTAEKLIVDLEKSEMINSNLQDVMKKVPGVLVTDNGISIAGKSGVRILINGKTTEYMDINTLLRDLPADNIAKVEIVEQPGAEYDASGSAAIINIILKKNVRLGTHGSFTLWGGEDEGFEYGTRASVSSYKNKLNWQASVGHSRPTWREDIFLKRSVVDETYDQATISPYNPSNLYGTANIDYYINENHSMGIGGRWNKRTSERIATSKTIISDNTQTNTLFSENSTDLNRQDYSINPYYEYKTETNRFLFDFNYINYNNNNVNNLYEVAGSTVNYNDRRYLQDGSYTIKTSKVDYAKTFSDNLKLSIGSKYSMVNTNNDLQSFEADTADNFVFDTKGSNRFLIDETIFALYSKLNASVGKWTFSGGLRFEDSKTTGTSTNPTETNIRDIEKLFPSAAVSRKINDNLGANLSYSYRINRPSYNSLNSFATYLDPFSAGEGNPKLKPSFTNNYQFNLTFDGQPFFTIGYSETDDVIFELIRQDNTTAQIRQQEVNVESLKNWDFRLFGPLSFLKGLDGYTGFIVMRKNYLSAIHNVNLSQWNLFWFIQASYKLPWDINFEVSGTYGNGALEGQIEVDWLAELDFSLGKKFMDDRLKVNLGFSDMLNRGFHGKIDYGNGNAVVESNGSRQNIQLRLTYSFGSKFGKKKSKRNSSNEEENRIQDNN